VHDPEGLPIEVRGFVGVGQRRRDVVDHLADDGRRDLTLLLADVPADEEQLFGAQVLRDEEVDLPLLADLEGLDHVRVAQLPRLPGSFEEELNVVPVVDQLTTEAAHDDEALEAGHADLLSEKGFGSRTLRQAAHGTVAV